MSAARRPRPPAAILAVAGLLALGVLGFVGWVGLQVWAGSRESARLDAVPKPTLLCAFEAVQAEGPVPDGFEIVTAGHGLKDPLLRWEAAGARRGGSLSGPSRSVAEDPGVWPRAYYSYDPQAAEGRGDRMWFDLAREGDAVRFAWRWDGGPNGPALGEGGGACAWADPPGPPPPA